MDQDGTWHRGRPRPTPHCSIGTQLPLPNRGTAPQFLAHVCCGQTAGWIKMSLGTEGRPRPGDTVSDGDPAPLLPKKRAQQPSPLSAQVYCGQTSARIKMPLGTNIGLDLSDIVLDGDPPPPKRGHNPRTFGPCLLWPNGWMDQDVTWYIGRRRPRQHCVRWGLSSPPVERGTAAPTFRPMSIVAKRSRISATAELLLGDGVRCDFCPALAEVSEINAVQQRVQ